MTTEKSFIMKTFKLKGSDSLELLIYLSTAEVLFCFFDLFLFMFILGLGFRVFVSFLGFFVVFLFGLVGFFSLSPQENIRITPIEFCSFSLKFSLPRFINIRSDKTIYLSLHLLPSDMKQFTGQDNFSHTHKCLF